MNRRWRYEVFAAFVAAVLFAGLLVAAIDRGAIQGTITDQQGAVVPGATVVVTNVDTNVKVTLTTNSTGFYSASELIPGNYAVHVSFAGFSPVEFSNLTITAGITIPVDAQLQVGAATEVVEVTAAPPLVESSAANFTTAALQTKFIEQLPLQGRDIQSLVQLMPGVTQSIGPSGVLFGFNSAFGGFPDPTHLMGSGISANGGQGGANAWYLDGSLNAAQGAENVVVNPAPDAVAEFNLINNGLAAEWGRTSGAVVNVVLKSGSNELHGNAYEFNRNSLWSATNPFSRRDARGEPFLEPSVNWNNFGGTLGGPLRKDRTFFFVSYDLSILNEKKPTILTVPLPNQIRGDFRGDPRFASVCDPAGGVTNCLYDPFTTTGPDAAGLFHRVPFTTPVIPADRIDPLAAFYLSSYPAPNFVDPLQQGPGGCGSLCNNFLGTVGSGQNTQNISVKIDHNISQKHKFFGEWLFNPTDYKNFKYPWNGATAPTQTGIAGANPYKVRNQVIALGLTSTLSPTLVNEARVMFSRQNLLPRPNADEVTDTEKILQQVEGLDFYLFGIHQTVPNINAGSLSFGPRQWQNASQGEQAYTFIDNVSKIMGNHTLKGGLMFRRDNLWYTGAWGYNLNFRGGLTTDPVTGLGGDGIAQFLLGAVDQGSGSGTFHSPWQTTNYWAFYLQDEYRVTPNFTMNIGLRYDIIGWPIERYDDIANFDFGTNPVVPLPGRIDYMASDRHPSRNIFPAHKNSLGPRFSFVWSPFGNRKTVIRGAYGIIYSNGLGAIFGAGNGSISGPAYANFISYQGDRTTQRPAWRLSDGSPGLGVPALDIAEQNDEQFLGTSTYAFTQGSRDPLVQQWSLYIQRELPFNVGLSVGYVGTYGSHLSAEEVRDYNYTRTATRLALRNNLVQPVPVDAALAPIYGCPTDPASGQALCPGNLVLRPSPLYQTVSFLQGADGFNRYHSFQMKVEKRYSQGLNFILAYTIQKNMASVMVGSIGANTANAVTLGRAVGRMSFIPGAGGGAATDGFSNARAEDADDRRRYYGFSPDDIPQILNMAVSYDLPFGEGKPFLSGSGWADKVLGGWTLTQNWNFQTGVPLLFTSAACNGISCRPNLIGDPSRGRGSKTHSQLQEQYFDPTAFEAPFGSDPAIIEAVSTGFFPDGTEVDFNALEPWWQFGNIGTRPPTGRMPGYWNADWALAKEVHLTETKYLQFRWEVFNVFNHQNLGVPNTQWCLPPNPDGSTDAIHVFGCQFGKITNIQTDPRGMQFGMKFYF